MENVKELQNDPDKRKKALKSTTCSDVIQLALHITMVVIGVQVGYKYKYKYYNLKLSLKISNEIFQK